MRKEQTYAADCWQKNLQGAILMSRHINSLSNNMAHCTNDQPTILTKKEGKKDWEYKGGINTKCKIMTTLKTIEPEKSETVKYKRMKGCDGETTRAAKIINEIFSYIERTKCTNKKTTLYLGERQRYAISLIESRDVMMPVDVNFAGYAVVWVMLESHVQLV